MPASGTVVTSSRDTRTPETLISANALLTSRDMGVPDKPRYFLAELAKYVCRWEDDVDAQRLAIEAARRLLERECERGRLRGLRVGRNIMVLRAEWERYVADANTICDN